MPQTACSFLFFPAGDALTVQMSDQIQKVVAKGAGVLGIDNAGRPFIPFAGMELDASGAYVLAPVAQNIANMPGVILAFFQAALNASTNYVNNVVGADAIVNPDANNFAGYLFKLLSNVPNSDRYFQIANFIFNFWTNADPAWTVTQYTAAVTQFRKDLFNYADKNYFIPNADYIFSPASVFNIAWTAFIASDPNIRAMDSIEIYI